MPRLQRTPATWLIYIQLGLYTYFLYGFGPMVAVLRDEQGVSNALASLHSTGLAVGAVFGGAAFAGLSQRFGRPRLMWGCVFGMAAGLLLFIVLPGLYPVTLALTIVVSFFGISIINAVVVSLTQLHGPAGPAAISEANAMAVFTGLISPLVLGLSMSIGFGWRGNLGVLIGMIAIVTLIALRRRLPWRLRSRVAPPADHSTRDSSLPGDAQVGPPGQMVDHGQGSTAPAMHGGSLPGDAQIEQSGQTAGHRQSPVPQATHDGPVSSDTGIERPEQVASRPKRVPKSPLGKAYWLAWTMMVMTGAIEMVLALWSAIVLRERVELTPAAAAAAVSAITGGMLLGRVGGARFALRMRTVPLYFAALAVSMLGFTIFWLAQSPALAITGLLITGLGNGMHYPLAIALALAVAPSQPDRAAGFAAYGMGVSFGVAPFALGVLADEVGAHGALLLVPAFIAVAAALAWWLRASTSAPQLRDRPVEIAEQAA